VQCDVFDPCVEVDQVRRVLGLEVVGDFGLLEEGRYDAVLLAVAHRQFVELGVGAFRKLCREGAVVYDLKGVFGKGEVDLRLVGPRCCVCW